MLLSYGLKVAAPGIPFMDRMGIVFLAAPALALALAAVLYYVMPAAANADRITTESISDKMTGGFNVASAAVVAILVALYATWW